MTTPEKQFTGKLWQITFKVIFKNSDSNFGKLLITHIWAVNECLDFWLSSRLITSTLESSRPEHCNMPVK